jgi:hypothetical protein
VVKAGTLPVVGATVQVYAAGTTRNGSAPTALLSAALTTDANGAFSVPASYTCPTSEAVVYAMATGGQAGASGVSNSGIGLVDVLGACAAIKSGASFTVNEATTVAAAYALAPFAAKDAVGATSTNSSGIALAAGTAANLVNASTGVVGGVGFPATGVLPVAKIDALANVVNACVVGGVGSGACSQLFALGTGVEDTFAAMVAVAQKPGTSVSTVYALSEGAAAYTPVLRAQPDDWTLEIAYGGGGMSAPTAVSVDSTGAVWVANYDSVASKLSNTGVPAFASGITGSDLEESYGGAVDANDNFWIANEQSASANGGLGTVTELSSSGAVVGVYASGGLNFPVAIAFDPCGNTWVANNTDSVTVLSAAGAPVSGTAGYSSGQMQFPVAVATDANCNGYVANESAYTVTRVAAGGAGFTSYTVGEGPAGVAVDAGGNVWSANYYGDSVGLVSAAGVVASGGGFTGGGLDHPQGIAVDGAGSVWVANMRAPGVTELAGAQTSAPGAAVSPNVGWGADSGMEEAFGIAIDAGGSVWVSDERGNKVYQLVGLSAPVKTPLIGPARVP